MDLLCHILYLILRVCFKNENHVKEKNKYLA